MGEYYATIKTYIDVEKLTIDEAKREYGKLFFTFQQLLCCSEIEAAMAVSVATGVCPHCWERAVGCQCWNDE